MTENRFSLLEVDYITLWIYRRPVGSLASLEGPGGEQYAVRAKDRQAAAGGDHGNQYTGGKVAVKAHGPEAVDRKQASDEAAEVASTEVQDLAESKAVEVVAEETGKKG